MKNIIKKYKELVFVLLIIILIIFFQVVKLILDFSNKEESKITIESIYTYSEEKIKEDLLPNTIIVKVNGENIYKYDIDRYQYSIDSSDDSSKNALYELIKQKVLISKYADKDYFNTRVSLYKEVTSQVDNMNELEFNQILNIYGIQENEKWISDGELKNIIKEDLLDIHLYSDAMIKVMDKALENEENFFDDEYLFNLDQLNKMVEENVFEGKTQLISNIQDMYIERLILNSNIEFCSVVENGIISLDNISSDSVSEEEKLYSMTNGGTFAKWGNIIIYYDDYNYSLDIFNLETKEARRLCKTEVSINKLYFDGNYIYAVPSYYSSKKGTYKIDLLGNISKIYDTTLIQLWLTDEKIYFVDQIGFDEINQTPQGNLCVMNKDGSNKQVLIDNVKNYFTIYDNFIYYTDKATRNAYRSGMDGSGRIEIAKGRTYITSVTDKYLTYIDYSDGEKHRIVYFDGMENHSLGRFGNVNTSKNGTYFFTRKLIGEDNNIENEYTLYKVEADIKIEKEVWKNKEPLEHLLYIYNGYAYFRGNKSFYKVNLNNSSAQKENIDIGYSYFIDGKAYGFKSKNGNINELYIYDLETDKKEIINVNL